MRNFHRRCLLFPPFYLVSRENLREAKEAKKFEMGNLINEFWNDIELIIESPIRRQFHTRTVHLISGHWARFLLPFTREDSLDGSLFTWCSAHRYKSPRGIVERITYSPLGTTERALPVTQPVALTARLHCRRSHLHAEDAPTRFQPHSPERRRCIQGLYCLLICSDLASVSMEIIVSFGAKCRSESRQEPKNEAE